MIRRILLALAVLTIAGVAQTPLTTLQRRGFVLKSYRTALGLTQAQLSAVTFPHVTAAKLSRFERGLDSATAVQEDAIAAPLDSIVRARLGGETEAWLFQVVQRVRRP